MSDIPDYLIVDDYFEPRPSGQTLKGAAMKAYAVIGAIEFAELCAGKHVTLQTSIGTGQYRQPVSVELILSDIGFDVMEDAVSRARNRPRTAKGSDDADVPL